MLSPALRHRVIESPATSLFLRDGMMAAQLLLTDGHEARLLVAFAAGNSGVALWFEPSAQAVSWRVLEEPESISETDTKGRVRHGLTVRLEARGVSVLRIRRALLGSVRVLRDHQFDGRLPALGLVAAEVRDDKVIWQRERLDGAAGYALGLQSEGGRVELSLDDFVVLSAEPGQALRFSLRALTGDEPLKPLPASELLTPEAAVLPGARASLEFLAFEEKWLAGSWRFHTYFGRDTLMSVRLLLPVLQPAAIEAALASVLTRLGPAGEVAHEEDIGEFPILLRLAAGEAASAEPIFDYKMVDDDFMLLPVVAAYLLDTAAGAARAQAFMARADFGARLLRNIGFVLAQAKPFGANPVATSLIALKPGEIVGDWRDSGDGLAGGRYAYSVNAVLVPAALRAAERLLASGLLVSPTSSSMAELRVLADCWESTAPALFDMSLPVALAQAAVASYASELAVPSVALPAEGVEFSSLALDAAGRPLPVQHSDFSFALLLTDPPVERLARELKTLARRFPAGLMTDAGLLVANAVFVADEELRQRFGADRYHGAVVWSWQQAMVASGLARQLQRNDLPIALMNELSATQSALWQAILATRAVADSELWSWTYSVDGGYRVQSFGPLSATADESNAAQLWSTVYLAVKPPQA
jgi:hypothetical protein